MRIVEYAMTVIGRAVSVLLLAVFLGALAVWLSMPQWSIRFALSDEPANGWLGSMFFGFGFAGVLTVIWIIGSFLGWLFRPLPRPID